MITLLIVDDDQDILDGLSTTIHWEIVGITSVKSAHSGLEALRVMGKQPADIIITDVRMPGMNGIGLAETVSRDYPQTQIIILSGYSDFTYAQSAIRFGVSQYLLKPVVIRELMDAVYKCCVDIKKKDNPISNLLSPIVVGESGPKAKLVRDIRAYILKNFDKDFDVKMVAETVNRSPNYISHVFSECCGEQLIEYLNRVRVEHAKQLLLETDLTLYSLCNKVGYNDEKYFIKIFKKITGVTPSQFRCYVAEDD